MTPEQQARQETDDNLVAAGWAVQDYNFPFSYPESLDEQRRIVAEIETLVTTNLARVVRLKQSILQSLLKV